MKILKVIGVVVILVLLIVVVLALIAPKSYQVERNMVIHAPKHLVFRYMQLWSNFGSWSPWAERDSTMTFTVEGVDGQEGAKYIWEGDPKKTGTGEMTNTGVKANEEMTFHLFFKTPWKSHSDGYMRVADAGDSTKASWGFYGKYPIPWNIMLLFMPMDKMIGPDFERGLELLKDTVEAKAAKMANLKVKKMTYRSTSFAGIRKEVRMSEMKSFFESSFAKISQAMEAKGASMIGAPSAIFFSWEEEKGIADMAAGIPASRPVITDQVQMVTVPASNALSIDFYGPYEETELAHYAMMDYIQTNQISTRDIVLEEYLTDPASVPDPQKWHTRIVYLIK
ncbi:GyrI-like domain-containing protein [candidate division KSB1 bacterium]|nr:GyrI-like domain-containing protein [candidate division KSB1 bacterium]